jgi:major membrane immunogen (membrane-anchored lipoprotein)
MMELRKVLSTATMVLASTFVLAAFGGSNTNTAASDAASTASSVASDVASVASSVAEGGLKDGTYGIVEKNFDTRGWKTEFSITVVGGKITASTYENVNEAGAKKSEDADYEANMKAKTGTGPMEYFAALNSQLVEKQDPAAVEVVTGATNSSNTFKQYAQQLVDAAKTGKTGTVEIDNVVEE